MLKSICNSWEPKRNISEPMSIVRKRMDLSPVNMKNEKETPKNDLISICPGSSIESICPGSSKESICPGTSTESIYPGSSIESICPDSSIESICPGSSIESICLGSSMESICPGSSIESVYPGSSIESICPGSSQIENKNIKDGKPKRSIKQKINGNREYNIQKILIHWMDSGDVKYYLKWKRGTCCKNSKKAFKKMNVVKLLTQLKKNLVDESLLTTSSLNNNKEKPMKGAFSSETNSMNNSASTSQSTSDSSVDCIDSDYGHIALIETSSCDNIQNIDMLSPSINSLIHLQTIRCGCDSDENMSHVAVCTWGNDGMLKIKMELSGKTVLLEMAANISDNST